MPAVDVVARPRLVFLVVGFDNAPEVHSFIHQVTVLDEVQRYDVEIVVTVNRGNVADYRADAPEVGGIAVTAIDARANLGYLPACRQGLNAYRARRGEPDWVCVCNTDVQLDPGLFRLLDHAHDSIGQVSPLISTDQGVVQNPHLLHRPSPAAMRARLWVHRWDWFGAAYIALSMLRSRRRKGGAKRAPMSGETLELYSAHGSLFFLSAAFFGRGGTLDGAPILYSEELFIGEQLREHRLRSVCDTGVQVVHRSHGATGLLSLRRVSRLIRAADRALYQRYFAA